MLRAKGLERRRFDLQDPGHPRLYEEIFPYDEVPKVFFDEVLVPMGEPKDLFITDTTFRDGQQSRAPFTERQITAIFDLLHRLSGPQGIIRQCEFFLYSERDQRALRACQEKDYRYPQITGWIRANKKDFQLVKEMGLKETGILMSVSDYHIFLKMGLTRTRAMEQFLDIATEALDNGIVPRCHFEDVTRADIYCFVLPLVQALMDLGDRYRLPVKIRLCDTMGFGVTFSRAILPRSVPKLVYAITKEAGFPGENLEWHGHNDFHQVIANSVTAWIYGCSTVNGALLGLGERTGNAPVEALAIEHISLTGSSNGMDPRVITEIGDYFERELGYSIPHNYPFVGKNFNSTAAGIHADALNKDRKIYTIFDTELILNVPVGVTINEKSGRGGIALWANSHLRLAGEARVEKDHPGIGLLHQWMMDQYAQGRTTNMSDEELDDQARICLPDLFVSPLERIKRKVGGWALDLVTGAAESPEIQSMDPARQAVALQATVDRNPSIQFVYVVDMNGRALTPVVSQKSLAGAYREKIKGDEDYSTRDWFTKCLHDGRAHITSIGQSRITQELFFTASAPVRSPDGGMLGVLGMDIQFEEIAKMGED